MDYVFLCWVVVAIAFVVVNCLVWFGFLLCYMVLVAIVLLFVVCCIVVC